jgi:endonuclease YncB( thermonuclease family)
MDSDKKWRWAGIVSVASICGVILTETVANLLGGYISDQIKSWEPPAEANVASAAPAPVTQSEAKSSAAAEETSVPVDNEVVVAAVPMRDTKESQAVKSESLNSEPAPDPQPQPLSGSVEKVFDTATLLVRGQKLMLAGITGFGSPYRDQLEKFIVEQGGKVQCEPIGDRYSCYVSNVDLGLAALTNGAARTAADASPAYRKAEAEAKKNRRGIYQ